MRIPRILASHLFDLKQRKQFTGPEDFVLVSRNGNPVHPANMAARRLKVHIGISGNSGLAWSVFYKTRSKLRKELGEGLFEMFDDVSRFRNASHLFPMNCSSGAPYEYIYRCSAGPTRLKRPAGRRTTILSSDRDAQRSSMELGPSSSVRAFVQTVFLPTLAEAKSASRRAHYHALLKHVLTPECVEELVSSDGAR